MSKFSPYCIVKATRDGVQALAKRADVQRLDVFVDGEIASPELHDLPERTGPSTSFDQAKLISRHSSVTAYTGTGIHVGMLEEGLPSTNISSHLAGKLSNDRMYTAPGHTPNSDENIHASRVASVLVGSNGVVPGATLYCAAATTLSQALPGAECLITRTLTSST